MREDRTVPDVRADNAALEACLDPILACDDMRGNVRDSDDVCMAPATAAATTVVGVRNNNSNVDRVDPWNDRLRAESDAKPKPAR